MQATRRVATVLRENEWVALDSLFGPLSDSQELELRRRVGAASSYFETTLGLRETPLTLNDQAGKVRLRATGIAGTIRLGRWVLDVAPKVVDDPTSDFGWQASVLLLVSRVRGRHVGFNPVVELGRAGLSFVDHMALAFSDDIERASGEEAIHTYREREERTQVLRGRFNTSRQLRSMWSRPHLLECDVEYLDTDNPHNHLLHWAANRYAALAISTSVARRMEAARLLLPPLPGNPQLPSRLTRHVPPQYRSWQGAIDLAIELARGEAASMKRGAGGGYGFVLAMEDLFERFLEVTLGRALREWLPQLELKTQDSRPFAYPVHGGRKYFTRPDDVIYSGDEPIVVVDAKYKRLASKGELARLSKPRNADVYQILAAMTAHRCRRGVLIFPKVTATADLGDDQLRWWRVPTFGEEVHVAAVAIDLMELRSRSDLRRLDRRLADLVGEVGGLEPIEVDIRC